jgi:hypothetical protein
MTVLITEGKYDRFSAVFAMNDTPEKFEFHTDVITANEAAIQTYSLGTVLGKITATGKYIISKQAASDGSQVPSAIVAFDAFGAVKPVTLVAATDTKFVAVTRGKMIVKLEGLKLDVTFSSATHKQFAYDSLKAVGLLVEASV